MNRALGVADRHMLEAPRASFGEKLAVAVLRAAREILGCDRSVTHVRPTCLCARNRRAYLPCCGLDREDVLVGPATLAQVEDRLAGAVARKLGLRSVGVVDAQVGDEARIPRGGQQEDAVGENAEMGCAELADARGGE